MSDESQKSCPAPQPEKPQKKRPLFVGRITLGIVLIVMGCLLTAGMIMPQLDLMKIARYTPLILVLLGGEILIAAVRYGDRNVKVGFGMTLLCLILIGGSVCLSILPQVWNEYGLPHTQRDEKLVHDTTQAFYELVDSTAVENLRMYAGYEDTISYVDLSLRDTCSTETEFAEAAAPIVHALAELGCERVSIEGGNEKTRWTLSLEGVPAQKEITPQRISEILITDNLEDIS